MNEPIVEREIVIGQNDGSLKDLKLNSGPPYAAAVLLLSLLVIVVVLRNNFSHEDVQEGHVSGHVWLAGRSHDEAPCLLNLDV